MSDGGKGSARRREDSQAIAANWDRIFGKKKMTNTTESQFKREDILVSLGNGVSKITFYKKDGELREMLATRDFSIIPDDKKVEDEVREKRKVNPDSTAIAVYDVEKDAWRAFLLENLITFEKT